MTNNINICAALSQQAEPVELGEGGISSSWQQAVAEAKAEPAPAQDEREAATYVECRECTECGHAGINDQADGDSACSHCGWHGPSPEKDKCPECQRQGTMSASCPKCGCRYRLIADAEIATRPAQTEQQPVRMVRTKGCVAWEEVGAESFEFCQQDGDYECREFYAAPVAQPAQTELVEALRSFVSLSEQRLHELGELSPEMTECLRRGRAAMAAQGGE